MAAGNVETFSKAHQAFNGRDFDAVVSLMSEDMLYRNHGQNVADPKYIDAGDTVIAQFIIRGINDGPLGPLPATGKPVEVEMCEILRFNERGQIISGELYYDQLSFLVQLGHAPGRPL